MSKLQSKWIIWGHEMSNDDWTIESYKKLHEFDTIEGFWLFFNRIRNFKEFMLFMMRGDILPIYEDDECINGGYFSFVVPTYNLTDSILNLAARLIGETLTDTEMYDEIIGISISPKGSKSVIKIWNRNKDNQDISFYLKDNNFLKTVRYTPHKKNKN